MCDTIRWDINEDSVWELMQESQYGEWVLYEHHLAIVDKLKAEIAQLKTELLE